MSLQTIDFVIFFQKDIDVFLDGQTKYVRDLSQYLKKYFNVKTVFPRASFFHLNKKKRFSLMYLLEMFLTLNFAQIKFILTYRTELGKNVINLFVVEDVYSSLIPLILSKIFGIKLLYSASDYKMHYHQTNSHTRSLGNIIYDSVRSILENRLILSSTAVLARSLPMIKAMRADMKKPVPTFYIPHQSVTRERNLSSESVIRTRYSLVGRRVAIFVADLNYKPNRDAALYIINELSARIGNISSSVVFLIVGPGSECLRDHKTVTNVICLGEVVDLDDYLFVSDIGLSPSIAKGGTSSKIIDYLTHGLLVLATPESSQGVLKTDQMIISELQRFPDAFTDCLNLLRPQNRDFQNILLKKHYSSKIWYDKFRLETEKRMNKWN